MNGSSRRAGAFTVGHLSAVAAALLLATGCEQNQIASRGAVGADEAALSIGFVPTGQVCQSTGKHDKHGKFACAVCHLCAGTVSFDATVAGAAAAYDPTTANCSSVKCHSVPAGTFSYYFPGGDGEPVLNTVSFGGTAGTGTANWYDTGTTTCGVCHGYPPNNGYVWHNGTHGGGNTCQLCHPDATGNYCAPNTVCATPGAITNPSMHGNGVVNVSATFKTSCFGCH